jgi:hypothetical protein
MVDVMKSVQVKFRISEALRAKLRKAAAKSGRSLTEEASFRLDASFKSPKKEEDIAVAIVKALERHLSG